MQHSSINTVIVDDHALFRAGLIKLLESNKTVSIVGELDSGEAIEKLLAQKQVDLVILDISLPRINGLELIGMIRKTSPKTKILVLSMHRVAEYCRLALKRGAKGYILKEDAFDELNRAIEAVFNSDDSYISPSITKAVADQFLISNGDILPDVLTKTEIGILIKIASGLSNKQVALETKTSVRTIETHRAHILKKLKLKNTAGLVQYAIKQNLIKINKA